MTAAHTVTRTETIDGTAIAAGIRTRVAAEVTRMAATGVIPGLATVLIGDDSASAVYVAAKRSAVRACGMRDVHRHLPTNASQEQVAAVIDELADDRTVSGILLQLPLPAQLNAAELIDRIPVGKDVDGLTTASAGRLARGEPGLRPCTPSGVIALLDAEGIELKGARVTVIGWGELVGRPLAQLLLHRGATVTVAHEHTTDLAGVTRDADIVVVATGVLGLVGPEHIGVGATVVDVGIHRTPRGLLGDVRTQELRGIARRVTPVPGGVGPMTIAMLLTNTLRAAECQLRHQAIQV